MKKSNKAPVSYRTSAERRARQDKYFKIASLLAFFVCWEVIGRINLHAQWISAKFLPMPSEIIRALLSYAADGTLWKHMGHSLYRVLAGFAWGVVISLALGSFISESKAIDNIASPILNLFGPIPIMAFLPMFILWFGIGESSKIILIAYATVISMVSSVTEGLKNTDPILIRSAASLGAPPIKLFTRVKLQSALPGIFVGMKNALGVAFGAMVVAEMMGASTGLGYIIVFSKNWFKMPDMLMAAMIIGLLYSAMFGLLTAVERLLFRWKKDTAAHAIEK
jgi:sulfonate transport system permease protein